MQQLGLIINPHSKLNKRNPSLPKDLENIGKNFTVVRLTNSLAELDHAIGDFKRLKVCAIAICGGDGSLSRAVESICKIYKPDEILPPVFLLRGGTMNVVANFLGQRGSPTQRMKKIVSLIKQGSNLRTCPIRCLKVDGRIGFLYSDASAVNVLDAFYQNKTGPLGAFWLGIRLTLAGLRRSPAFFNIFQQFIVQLTYDDPKGQSSNVNLSHILGFVSFLDRLPMKIPIAPKNRDISSYFQGVFLKVEPAKLLQKLPLILAQCFLKMHHSVAELRILYTQKLRISSSNKIRYTLDGELYLSLNNHLTIQAGPSIQFILV